MSSINLRNNSTVVEELQLSIVNLPITNAGVLAKRSRDSKKDIWDCQSPIDFYSYSNASQKEIVHSSLKNAKMYKFKITKNSL